VEPATLRVGHSALAPHLTLMVCTKRADLARLVERHVDRGTSTVICETIAAATALSEQLTSAAALIIDSPTAPDDDEFVALSTYRRRFPLLPTLTLLSMSSQSQILPRLGNVVGRTAFLRGDDASLMREIILLLQLSRDSSPNGRIAQMLRAVEGRLRPVSQDFLAFMCISPRSVGTVAAAAEQLNVSSRTIERHLLADGFPQARVLFWNIVIYRALFVMQDAQCTVKRLVALLPFASASSVTLRFLHYIGSRPGRLRKRDAYWRMMEMLDARFDGWTKGCESAMAFDPAEPAADSGPREPVVAFGKELSLQRLF
jgi:hypothetical protein